MKIEDFLSPEQENAIADAIGAAEKNTSGEIRVHLDKLCKKDPLDRAKELFTNLKMHETKLRNGVIVYISVDDHKLAIFGDEGIHNHVGQEFWEEDIQILINFFQQDKFLDGILAIVDRIGEKLKVYFPYDDKGDINELDNTVSYGEGS